jgi:hypothetical protein
MGKGVEQNISQKNIKIAIMVWIWNVPWWLMCYRLDCQLLDFWGMDFFFLQYWGLNSGPSPWATLPALFLWRDFQDRVLRTLFLGWLQTLILLISVSWVGRIIGVSHGSPARSRSWGLWPNQWINTLRDS